MNPCRATPWCLPFLLTLAFVVAGCASEESAGAPRVWIDVPASDVALSSDAPVHIEGHAAYGPGVERVALWVDGTEQGSLEAMPSEGDLSRFEHAWAPPGDGAYVIQVVALGSDGTESAPDTVRVIVGGEGEGIQAAAGALPSTEPTQAASTPTPGASPSAAASGTATGTTPPGTPTPTATPPPGARIDFRADTDVLNAGACTTLRWSVDDGLAQTLGDEPVESAGAREVCPCVDTTFVLAVTQQDGSRTTRSVTVRVQGACVTAEAPTATPTPTTPPPDAAPPKPPRIVAPTGGAALPCEAAVLRWEAATDPSGIAAYRVEVEQEVAKGKHVPVSGSPWAAVRDTAIKVDLDCGGVFRWRVMAVDGAGNAGAFSPWASFGIALP